MKTFGKVVIHLTLVVAVFAVTTGRPPAIVKQPAKDVFFKARETVKLPCEAQGSPSPVYTWKRNGVDFNPAGFDDRVYQQQGVGTLTFVRPDDTDQGVYQCFATNPHGTSLSVTVNLREATLKGFGPEDDRTVSPSLGHQLTLNCVPPESIPPPFVFWVIYKPDGGFDPVSLDARVTMDTEYRLRFTNVKQSDGAGGRAYACIATNTFARKGSTSHRYFVNPQGGTEQLSPVSYMWSSPDDHFGIRGDNFTLKCIFAGNPTPEVHWERTDGHPLSDRANVQSFGQELVITDLQDGDAGPYRCWATNNNTLAPVNRTIDVRVESRPEWVEEPRDIEMSVGGTANVTCVAESVPQPMIYWSVNGVPLDKVTDPRLTGGRVERVSSDNIVFSKLTSNDSLVVQCNATNKHGYVWADFFLQVAAVDLTSAATVPATSTTQAAIRHEVVCGSTSMSFSIPMPTDFKQTATLSDPRCQARTSSNNSLYGSTNLNDCGTTLQVTNDSIVFSNNIILPIDDSSNSSVIRVIPIMCRYDRMTDLTVSAYMPVVRQVLFTETGVGQLSFRIRQYRDSSFTGYVSDSAYPLRLMPSEEVFVQLDLGGQQQPQGFGMDVVRCVASPSPSYMGVLGGMSRENLIDNNCPASTDVHLRNKTISATSNHSLFRFSFKAVTFPDPYDPQRSRTGLVYIHCRVRLCASSECGSGGQCPSPSALSRNKREAEGLVGEAGHQLSTGPLLVEGHSGESNAFSPLVVVMGAIAACATLVAMVAVVAWRRSRHRGHHQRLQEVTAGQQ